MQLDHNKSIYIGKFPITFGIDQLNEKCYIGGEIGSSLYKDMTPGDYVFPVREEEINCLWQMTEYSKKEINGNYLTVALFKEVKTFEDTVNLNEFIRNKEFNIDFTLLNKPFKSEKGDGFHKVDFVKSIEEIENIELKGSLRKVYITNDLNKVNCSIKDIIILIDNTEEMNIVNILIKGSEEYLDYDVLKDLYEEKNPVKYSIKDLQRYASENMDNTPNKLRYLTYIINELVEKEVVEEDKLSRIYDGIILGRKAVQGKAKFKIDNGIVDDIDNDMEEITEESLIPKYKISDILTDVFINKEVVNNILFNLDYKKNIILQGAPGVGKTFISKRIAYLHNGIKDSTKIEVVQFHESYGYEDFILGYKPNSNGGYSLRNGVFYDFCEKAKKDKDNKYYFIIEEINKVNLSKIFGETMMILERDKRGVGSFVYLKDKNQNDERFYIPKNVYIIGTMNTADKSLVITDYAVRRRFSFVDIQPAFKTHRFKEHLLSKGISNSMITRIVENMNIVNHEIIKDTNNLGKGYVIGHSYFIPTKNIDNEEYWYNSIIKFEIEPLLREYWSDNINKAEELVEQLL